MVGSGLGGHCPALPPLAIEVYMVEVSCSWLPSEEEFSSCLPPMRLPRCRMETGALPNSLRNSSLIPLLAGAQETWYKQQWQITGFSQGPGATLLTEPAWWEEGLQVTVPLHPAVPPVHPVSEGRSAMAPSPGHNRVQWWWDRPPLVAVTLL